MRPLLVAGTILALITACQPSPGIPGQTTPRPPTTPTAPAAPGPAETALSLHGTVTLKGQPFAGATVALALGRPGIIPAGTALDVQTGSITDAAGRFTIPLETALPAESLFLIAAQKGPTTLYSRPLITPAEGETGLATRAPYDHAIAIDLTSTILGKKFTPKLAELALSGPEAPEARQRLRSAVAQVAALQATIAGVLAQPPQDQRLLATFAGIGAEPEAADLESLANVAMLATDLQTPVRALLESIHLGVVRNMLDGGGLFALEPWLSGFASPVVAPNGLNAATIRFQGRTDQVVPTADTLAAGSPVPNLIARLNIYLGNTLIIPARIGGPSSGGGGGGGPVTPPYQLTGSVL